MCVYVRAGLLRGWRQGVALAGDAPRCPGLEGVSYFRQDTAFPKGIRVGELLVNCLGITCELLGNNYKSTAGGLPVNCHGIPVLLMNY